MYLDMGAKKKKKTLALVLLFLVLSFQLEISCCAASVSVETIRGRFDGNNGTEEGFGSQKRRVYTGPNPLHNR
ncbi:hypothetical protein QJS04_geneDACA015006 [Acorus gramineus]|uniref:Uncharacterized protein n=1 Tax=Acorus gramineus TaxID=55184 RepID=A0AAV9BWA8_ACOGR|nr:hypothetical protein QJS04_geneDACA015006 [Acorus gramineus]